MDVRVVGDSPATTAVAAGLAAGDVDVERVPLGSAADGGPPTVVPDAAGGDLLPRASDRFDGPWLAVEIGGIAGRRIEGLDGAIAALDGSGPCYRCLEDRLRSTGPHGEPADASVDPAAARYAGSLLAWRLRRGLADGRGTVLDLDGTGRRLLAVPGCPCNRHRRPSDRPALAHDPSTLEAALARAEDALDGRIGIVTEVGEQSSYPAPYYVASLADTTVFSDARAAELAAGVDPDWNAAFMRALGEALERYCAGNYRVEGLPAEPDGDPVHLDAFALADDGATPLGRWWPATELPGGDPVSVPAELVTFPTPEGSDVGGITTGLGLGSSTVEAALSGLLEVIERDACMLGWYSTFEPMRLAIDDPEVATLERRVRAEGLGVSLLVQTQDVDLPVVAAAVHRRDADGEPVVDAPGVDPDDWPAFAVGSAAALDPIDAAERALVEAIQNWVELDGMGPDRAAEEGAYGRYASFPREVRDFLVAGPTVTPDDLAPPEASTGAAAIERVLGAARSRDLSVYLARTTTPDVADLGFEAVRALVPRAQPLVRGRGTFSERARSVPRELGFRPRLDRGPHPYP